MKDVSPGDVIVLRGHAVWNDIGFDNRWARFRSTTGNQPKGTKGTGYLTIEAYPGEDVHFVPQQNTSGGIHGIGDSFPEYSDRVRVRSSSRTTSS